MLLKWIWNCIKNIFPSLEDLFWVFLLKAAANFHSTYWQINTFEMSNLLSIMTEVHLKLEGRRWMDQHMHWLCKLHFHSKVKINVGFSFLIPPVHKNSMGHSSMQPTDIRVQSGKLIKGNHQPFCLVFFFVYSNKGPRATYSEWLSKMGGKAQGISRYHVMYR